MKILVVEAEETAQKVMGVMLTRLGYKVELTSNCNEAFRAYSEKGPFDVVSDQHEICARFRGRRVQIHR